MQFSIEHSELNLISKHDDTSITIKEQQYTTPLLVTPEKIIQPWEPIDFNEPNVDIVATIAKFKPEIVIISTGKQHQHLPAKLLQAFIHLDIAPECMSTSAACRTYNVLLNEGRKVIVSIQF